MSEKLCLQWNDFKDNVINTFGNLREDDNFTDVTLVCEDGKQIDAHKVILVASSPVFGNMLRKSKHSPSHPIIYMRGVNSNDLQAIVDFLYLGEANVYQENLDSFLAVAEELQLKGLKGNEDVETLPQTQISRTPSYLKESKTNFKSEIRRATEEKRDYMDLPSGTVAINGHQSGNLLELLHASDQMLEKTESKMPNGKPMYKCTACGKQGEKGNIRNHIEAAHFEGISLPCNTCGKVFRSRNMLSSHNWHCHRINV